MRPRSHDARNPHRFRGEIPIRADRPGMTLWEVIVALAIFSGSLAVLGQAVTTGSRAAVQSKLQSRAILHCEAKLADLLAGVEPIEETTDAEFEEESEKWTWSLHVEAGPNNGLLYLIVSVVHSGSNADADASFSISRLVRNPALLYPATDPQEEDGREN